MEDRLVVCVAFVDVAGSLIETALGLLALAAAYWLRARVAAVRPLLPQSSAVLEQTVVVREQTVTTTVSTREMRLTRRPITSSNQPLSVQDEPALSTKALQPVRVEVSRSVDAERRSVDAEVILDGESVGSPESTSDVFDTPNTRRVGE